MNTFKNISIKKKLVIIIITTSIVALIAGLATYLIFDMVSAKKEMKKNALLNATLIGQYASAPLLFGYKEEASEVLAKLNTIPSIKDACLYSSHSEDIFATYHSTADTSFRFPHLQNGKPIFKDGYLHVFYAIKYNEQYCGTIYLRITASSIHEKFRSSITVMVILVLLLIITVFMIAYRLQRVISAPILELAELTATISQNQDFTIQLKPHGKDEVGILYRQFNNLLSQLLKRQKERDKAEEKLKESEAHFRYLFEQNPALLLIYELDSLEILAVNDAFINHYGFTRDELLSMHLTDLYPEHEKEAIASLTKELIGLTYVGEWHHFKKDGTIITIEVNSHGVDYDGLSARIAVINDVTEREEMEKSLRINENQLSAIYNTISDILYFISVEPNDLYRFISVNEMFLKATGLKKDQVINKRVEEVIPQQVHELIFGKYKEAIETKQTVFWEEISEYPSGKKYGLVKITPTYNESGVCTNLVGSVHDITTIRETENEIRQLNAALENRVIERTSQLVAINKELESFSYSISHDLRAPLRAIFGFSQILARRHRESLNEEGRQYMDYIVEASVRMEQLINDLLNYSRLGRKSLEMRPVSLQVIVGNIFDDFEQKLQEIGAKFIVDKDLPEVLGDESLLRQIFTNLIENAITYRQTDVPLKIEISCEQVMENFTLKISDNGIGIPQEYWEKIFNIFQRLHSEDKYPGTGIGLATVKKAVGMLNGSVRVESVVGEGSSFIINLPVYKN
jgi:PAS domain S-box-containing protein